VQLFGALLAETVLAPVPHRHFTFTIPKMLRPYFRFHRGLIKELCRIAHRCLAEFQRTTLGLPEGTTGVVMAIQERGQSRVLTQFKKSEKFGVWQDNSELNMLGRFTM